MFQHMGPLPSGWSGHVMVLAGSRVFVIGRESSTVSKPDDPSIVHVLETSECFRWYRKHLIPRIMKLDAIMPPLLQVVVQRGGM
jgi:hypothetical protein